MVIGGVLERKFFKSFRSNPNAMFLEGSILVVVVLKEDATVTVWIQEQVFVYVLYYNGHVFLNFGEYSFAFILLGSERNLVDQLNRQEGDLVHALKYVNTFTAEVEGLKICSKHRCMFERELLEQVDIVRIDAIRGVGELNCQLHVIRVDH